MVNIKLFEDFKKVPDLFLKQKELKRMLLENKKFPNGNIVEAFVDIFFNNFATYKINKEVIYRHYQTLKFAEKFGNLPLFIYLITNYNNQVNLVGHSGYNNHILSYDTIPETKKLNINYHTKMINLFKKLDLVNLLNCGEEVYFIINSFKHNNHRYDTDSRLVWSLLDFRCNDIYKIFISELNEHLKTLYIDGEKIEDLIEFCNQINKYNL